MSLGLTEGAIEGAINEFYSIIGGIDSSLDNIHEDLVRINCTLIKLVDATSLTETDKQNIAWNRRFHRPEDSHDSEA